MTNIINMFSQERNCEDLIWHKINSSTAGKQSDIKSFAV